MAESMTTVPGPNGPVELLDYEAGVLRQIGNDFVAIYNPDAARIIEKLEAKGLVTIDRSSRPIKPDTGSFGHFKARLA